MSYNGIGLSTVRGSATSGHVIRNLSYIPPRKNKHDAHSKFKTTPPKQANAELLEHERKRKVELEVLEFRENLEEQEGVSEENIEEQCNVLRIKLLEKSKLRVEHVSGWSDRKSKGTHVDLEKLKDKDLKLREAFGIASTHVPGEAFDRVVQEKKKRERIETRKATSEYNHIESSRGKSSSKPRHRSSSCSSSSSSSRSSSSSSRSVNSRDRKQRRRYERRHESPSPRRRRPPRRYSRSSSSSSSGSSSSGSSSSSSSYSSRSRDISRYNTSSAGRNDSRRHDKYRSREIESQYDASTKDHNASR